MSWFRRCRRAKSEGEEVVASLEEADMTTGRGPACFYSCNCTAVVVNRSSLGVVLASVNGLRFLPEDGFWDESRGSVGRAVIIAAGVFNEAGPQF
jgi:hypothetical protein